MFHRAMRLDRILSALASAHLRGEGIATELPAGHMAFLKSRPDAALPERNRMVNQERSCEAGGAVEHAIT